LPLLSWGIVDGKFCVDEVLARADHFLAENHVQGISSARDLVDAMESESFLWKFREGRDEFYRTRSGEAIRLFARLKQLVPKHLRDRPWSRPPNLVADFRVLMRPGKYPRRNIAPASAEEWLRSYLDGGKRALLRKLLGVDSDNPLQLAAF